MKLIIDEVKEKSGSDLSPNSEERIKLLYESVKKTGLVSRADYVNLTASLEDDNRYGFHPNEFTLVDSTTNAEELILSLEEDYEAISLKNTYTIDDLFKLIQEALSMTNVIIAGLTECDDKRPSLLCEINQIDLSENETTYHNDRLVNVLTVPLDNENIWEISHLLGRLGLSDVGQKRLKKYVDEVSVLSSIPGLTIKYHMFIYDPVTVPPTDITLMGIKSLFNNKQAITTLKDNYKLIKSIKDRATDSRRYHYPVKMSSVYLEKYISDLSHEIRPLLQQ